MVSRSSVRSGLSWRLLSVSVSVAIAGVVLGACGNLAPTTTSGVIAADPDEAGMFGRMEFGGGLSFVAQARSCAERLDDGRTRQVFLGVDDVSATSLEVVITSGVGPTEVAVQNPGQNVPFLTGTADPGSGLTGTFVEDGSSFMLELDGTGAAAC